jgi:GGDEF domain-containing protein
MGVRSDSRKGLVHQLAARLMYLPTEPLVPGWNVDKLPRWLPILHMHPMVWRLSGRHAHAVASPWHLVVEMGVGKPDLDRRSGQPSRRAIDAARSDSDADQAEADADQTGSDRDQTAADRDQTAADRDEVHAANDQRAADGDQTRADECHLGDLGGAGLEATKPCAPRARRTGLVVLPRTSPERGPLSYGPGRPPSVTPAGPQPAKTGPHRAKPVPLASELLSANLDDLTGAFRREMGRLVLNHEIDRARRGDGRFVIVFADVDGLKRVNDRDGHAAGDHVLETVVWTVRSNLRSFDPIVRYGGDEFVCGLGGVDHDVVARRFEVIDRSVQSDVGVGISVGLWLGSSRTTP